MKPEHQNDAFVIDRETAISMVRRPPAIASLGELNTFFAAEGYLDGVSFEYKLRRLKKSMGQSRYDHSQAIQAERDRLMAQGRYNEAPSENSLYALMQSAAEAHVFYSIQGEIAKAANAASYDAVLRDLPPKSVVVDAGCYTGSFVRFVAQRHSTIAVYGYDHLPNLIAIAKERTTVSNAEFAVWDYLSSDSPPLIQANAITSILGLPFGELMTAEDLREASSAPGHSPLYSRASSLVSRAARNWNHIAAPNAALCLVARAGTPELILAVVHGACEAGWRFRKQATQILKTASEAIPLFVFEKPLVAGRRESLSAEEAASLWVAGIMA